MASWKLSEFADMPAKWKIYHEQAKSRQTSHWDWDTMTTAQIDAAIRSSREDRDHPPSKCEPTRDRIWQNLLGWFKRPTAADK
jgi:hypothetical protein